MSAEQHPVTDPPALIFLPEPLILASASPRRKELLERLGLKVRIEAAQVEELDATHRGPPQELALLNARLKARVVAEGAPTGSLVLAADTVVALRGRSLGKPQSAQDATRMLESLSGRTHAVITAFVIMRAPHSSLVEQVVRTRVTFKTLSADEISFYVSTGEPFDKAGGYGIQGIGAFFVRRIAGSYTNVVGLPLTETLEALERCCASSASVGTRAELRDRQPYADAPSADSP